MGTNIDCREGQTAPINANGAKSRSFFFLFFNLSLKQQYQVIQSAKRHSDPITRWRVLVSNIFFRSRDKADSRAETSVRKIDRLWYCYVFCNSQSAAECLFNVQLIIYTKWSVACKYQDAIPGVSV